jgi:hypothetical protein
VRSEKGEGEGERREERGEWGAGRGCRVQGRRSWQLIAEGGWKGSARN